MSKINKNKVCYNVNPDPITSIKEYKIDENGKLVLVKEDKPKAGKTYQLTGKPGEKTIENGNTWKESEVK
jgi:hypothetical protein